MVARSDLTATGSAAGQLAELDQLTVAPPVDHVRRAVMVQTWSELVFLHWRVEPSAIQRLLPTGVEVDTFDGTAWIGLIPFSMEGLGVPGLAPLPHVGAFPEVNVRTYVRCGPHRGVWFFSLDVDRRLPAYTARAVYALPYCWGDATHGRDGDIVTSRVERRWPSSTASARTSIRVRTGDPVDAAEPLHRFLTARWGLVAVTRWGGHRWAPVDHPAWPLHAAEVLDVDDTLVAAAGVQVEGPPDHAMWSPGVPVRVGRPRRVRIAAGVDAAGAGRAGVGRHVLVRSGLAGRR